MHVLNNKPIITIFTSPKPFQGHSNIIQRNAIKSWSALGSCAETFLIGDDDGVAEAASEFGAGHISKVETSPKGAPFISSIFEKAQQNARSNIMVFVNADIILTQNILNVIEHIRWDRYLISGRRRNLDINEELDFNDAECRSALNERITKEGVLGPPTAMDCFIFPKGMFENIPEFAIGRAGWDCWMVYSAMAKGSPVVDATGLLTILHQNHDYSHHPQGLKGTRTGPEAEKNIELAGGRDYIFTLNNANYIMDKNGPRRPPLTLQRFMRRIRALPALYPYMGAVLRPIIFLGKIVARTIFGKDRTF